MTGYGGGMPSESKPHHLLDENLLKRAPKVLLHEHLDGGLRPSTCLDLAELCGYEGLPADEPEALAACFAEGADRKSLPLYLEGFGHTIAVMQTEEALSRCAREAVEDLAADGVVYAELRFAPHFHTASGLGLQAVMEAVLDGLAQGSRSTGITARLLVCAMRNEDPELSEKLAALAIRYRDAGCGGFDLAGEEAGHPANHHVRAFQLVQRENFSITIHAGESFGPASIWQALQFCGAHRIGHGVRLVEDLEPEAEGRLAQYVLDHRIPLEVCLSSNVHTGATQSLATHQFPKLWEGGYRVTLNTDNRLMSATTMTKEYRLAHEHYGLDLNDLEKIAINGMKSAFAPYSDRIRLIYDAIKPGYATLRAELEIAERHPHHR
jgi:adenosine deaminase